MSKFASFFANIRPDRSVKHNFQCAASPTRLGATKKHLFAYPQVQKNTRTYSPHINKNSWDFHALTLQMVNAKPCGWNTHSLSQPSTAYRNIPQLSSTWHSATKVLISSYWILLKLSVCLIYFVHSMVSELSMCLVVLYDHLPSSTLVMVASPGFFCVEVPSRHFPRHWLLHHVYLRKITDNLTPLTFSLGGWNLELPILRSMLVGVFARFVSQNTKSRSIAKRLEP